MAGNTTDIWTRIFTVKVGPHTVAIVQSGDGVNEATIRACVDGIEVPVKVDDETLIDGLHPQPIGDTGSDSLVEELQAAKRDFRRPAVPSVFAEYQAFMATGDYPYIDTVKAWILDRHDVPAELARQLQHEVYLASGQYRAAEMAADEEAARAEGWLPITDLDPVEGQRIELRGRKDGNPYRVKPDGRDGWALIARGKRTTGYRLADQVAHHQAFERAKQQQQTAMDGPAVVMFRIADR